MLLNKICDQNFFFHSFFFSTWNYVGKHFVHWTVSNTFFSIKIYDKEIMIWQFSYHTPYQPSTSVSALDSHISPRAFGLHADMGVSGWYGSLRLIRGMIWKLPYDNLLILSLVGISTDARKLASFDIPTRDNIHRYQCNNPIILIYHFWFLLVRSIFWQENMFFLQNTTES